MLSKPNCTHYVLNSITNQYLFVNKAFIDLTDPRIAFSEKVAQKLPNRNFKRFKELDNVAPMVADPTNAISDSTDTDTHTLSDIDDPIF